LIIAQELRDAGINVDIDLMNRGPSKNINYANTFDIPYVIFIGEDEVKSKKVKLKNMKTGKEKLISVKEAINDLL